MPNDCLTVQVERKNISFVKWIVEGCEDLGVVTTVDNQDNILFIRSTPDMMADLQKIMASFDFPVKIINS